MFMTALAVVLLFLSFALQSELSAAERNRKKHLFGDSLMRKLQQRRQNKKKIQEANLYSDCSDCCDGFLRFFEVCDRHGGSFMIVLIEVI